MATGTLFLFIFILLVLMIAAIVAAVVAALVVVRSNRRREARGFEVQPVQRTRDQ